MKRTTVDNFVGEVKYFDLDSCGKDVRNWNYKRENIKNLEKLRRYNANLI